MINFKKILIVFVILFVSSLKSQAEINDSIFATVGNKVITRSDIVNEIKILLISSNQEYSDDRLDALQAAAVKALIKRKIKKIEISKYDNLEFNPDDLFEEINNLARSMNTDLDTLKNALTTNEIDYELIKEIYKTELLWNSLIFELYKNSISINKEEIDEQLELLKNKKYITEYLISEIIIPHVAKVDLKKEIENIKNQIKLEGFENIALKLSISESALKGGDIGWIGENTVPENLRIEMEKTKIGNISEPMILPEGILIFKLRDKKQVENIVNLNDVKNKLIRKEKAKILNMHSLSHYDKLRRSITIKYY